MQTCKCGKTKLGPIKGYPGCTVQIGCPFCKTTVTVTT